MSFTRMEGADIKIVSGSHTCKSKLSRVKAKIYTRVGLLSSNGCKEELGTTIVDGNFSCQDC